MIEDKIEIMIPTYNRAKYLNQTLNSLLQSPFKDCKITIRDNATPDDTPKICEKYANLFGNMNIIRNKKNIGGNANIIRCYEEAEAPFVWVLADNDLLNFDGCEDFINAIESEKYDMIMCSSGNYLYSKTNNPTFNTPGLSELLREKNSKENYLENSAHDLVSIIQRYYFSVCSFIPTAIYKTSLIDFDYLLEGYNYISRSYPHFPLLVKVLNENGLTYKTKKDIVLIQENPNPLEIGALNYYSRRLECALLVEDRTFRDYATKEPKGGMIYQSFAHIITSKVENEENRRQYLFKLIFVGYELKGFFVGTFYAILFVLFFLIPKSICRYIFKKRWDIE